MVRDCRGVAVFQNQDYHLLVMERCPGLTLFDLIEQRTRLPEAEARRIFTQVLNPMTTYLNFKSLVVAKIFNEFLNQ